MGRTSGRVRPEFEWDEDNEEKLLNSHKVSAKEAEQCFSNPHDARRDGDDMVLLGKTDGDRMLLLVYQHKPNGMVRVYSARNMNDKEKQTYRRNAR